MSDPNTLGSLVRKRRLESGYSLGQLASKVGKTAAEVRAWERDTEMPEHGIIERLASTLEIDLGEIQKRLEEGKKALEEERKAAREAEAATAAEEDEAAAEQDEEEAEEPETTESEDELPGFAVDDPFTPPPPVADATPVVSEATEDEDTDRDDTPVPDMDLLDAPTEPVPVPVITETATAARAGRAAVVLEEPPPAPVPAVDAPPDADPGLLRYLEPLRILFDPHSRYLYWIRAGLTAIVMLIFMVILLQQLGNLLDAIGELLDTIEPTAPDPDSLDV